MQWFELLSRKVHRVIQGSFTPEGGPNRLANRESHSCYRVRIWVLRSTPSQGSPSSWAPVAHIWISSHDRHWNSHLILSSGWYHHPTQTLIGVIMCLSSWDISLEREFRSPESSPHVTQLPFSFWAPKDCLTCSANLATRRKPGHVSLSWLGLLWEYLCWWCWNPTARLQGLLSAAVALSILPGPVLYTWALALELLLAPLITQATTPFSSLILSIVLVLACFTVRI